MKRILAVLPGRRTVQLAEFRSEQAGSLQLVSQAAVPRHGGKSLALLVEEGLRAAKVTSGLAGFQKVSVVGAGTLKDGIFSDRSFPGVMNARELAAKMQLTGDQCSVLSEDELPRLYYLSAGRKQEFHISGPPAPSTRTSFVIWVGDTMRVCKVEDKKSAGTRLHTLCIPDICKIAPHHAYFLPSLAQKLEQEERRLGLAQGGLQRIDTLLSEQGFCYISAQGEDTRTPSFADSVHLFQHHFTEVGQLFAGYLGRFLYDLIINHNPGELYLFGSVLAACPLLVRESAGKIQRVLKFALDSLADAPEAVNKVTLKVGLDPDAALHAAAAAVA